MSLCAMRKTWANARCVCGHGAGVHATSLTEGGCYGVDAICNCHLEREEVLFAATQRAMAEVCEHREQRRTYRSELRRPT